jgi:hypothetical protein
MIIAERNLFIRGAGTPDRILVTIAMPTQTENAWACRYRIGWPSGERSSEVFGFDSMQALLHAMQAVGAELYSSEAHSSGRLFWTDEDDGYGFPIPKILRDKLNKGDADYL